MEEHKNTFDIVSVTMMPDKAGVNVAVRVQVPFCNSPGNG